MGTAEVQGRLWGARPRAWAELQESANAPMYEAAFDAAGLSDGQRYLDIGCGAGLALSLAAARGAEVSGLDAAAGLAELARARCPDADIRIGELEELPFADGTFDIVSGFNSFQYAADKVNGLAQAKRVMKDGGKLIVLVWGQPEECEMAGYLKALGGLLPPPPPGAPGPWALSPPGALEDLAGQAGLRTIHAETVPITFDFASEQDAVRGLLAPGPATLAIQTSGEGTVAEAIRGAIAPFRRADGSYSLRNAFRFIIAVKA